MVYYTGPNKKVTRLSRDSSPTESPSTPNPTSSSPSSKKFPIWAIIVIILFAIIIVGSLYYWNKNSKNQQPSPLPLSYSQIDKLQNLGIYNNGGGRWNN